MGECYRLSSDDVLRTLETTLEKGLSQVDVQARLATYGPNQLVERGIKSP